MIDRRDLDLNRRRDLEIISDLVQPGDRVLDLGCGDGKFLAHLRKERKAEDHVLAYVCPSAKISWSALPSPWSYTKAPRRICSRIFYRTS